MLERVCEDGPEQVQQTEMQQGKDILEAGILLWQAAQQHNQDCHWERLAVYFPAMQTQSISFIPALRWLENTEIFQLF